MWSAHLVDYLDVFVESKVIDQADNNNATNFQKHAATLDASVRIYSSRVDAVHNDTYKMLGGLTRGQLDTEEPEETPTKQNQAVQDTGAAIEAEEEDTRKRISRRGVDTLETNEANLNIKKLELDFAVDPLFRKTSAAFDEGGAHGLLLNHLGVYNGTSLMFTLFPCAPLPLQLYMLLTGECIRV